MRSNWFRCEKCGSGYTELISFTEDRIKYLAVKCLHCKEERIIQKEYLKEDDEEYND